MCILIRMQVRLQIAVPVNAINSITPYKGIYMTVALESIYIVPTEIIMELDCN